MATVMTFVNIVLFVIGLILGAILFFTILLPILYQFPKAIFLSTKGMIKPISILATLRTPIAMFVLLVLLCILFPNVLQFFERPLVNNGSNIAMTLLFISRFVFRSGRMKSRAEFWLLVFKYRVAGKWKDDVMK